MYLFWVKLIFIISWRNFIISFIILFLKVLFIGLYYEVFIMYYLFVYYLYIVKGEEFWKVFSKFYYIEVNILLFLF